MVKYVNFFNLVHILQLFRRVAAALPGMDSTENKPPEDSILCSNCKELFLVMSVALRNFFTYMIVINLSCRKCESVC